MIDLGDALFFLGIGFLCGAILTKLYLDYRYPLMAYERACNKSRKFWEKHPELLKELDDFNKKFESNEDSL